ncbi:MAG: radical SAM protein [Magnetococcales bacterium]|nr:radical SAM protein [Magnetococcales bacterium]
MAVSRLDLIIITQSEQVDTRKLSSFPLDQLAVYANLVFPRTVYYQGGFRLHTDLLNMLGRGVSWNDAGFAQRREMHSVWNLPGFSGIHLAAYLLPLGFQCAVINNFDAEADRFAELFASSDPPPLVGISTTFHLNWTETRRLTRQIRDRFPEARFVMGGAFVHDQVNNGAPGSFLKTMAKYGIHFALSAVNPERDLVALLTWYRQGARGQPDHVANLLHNHSGTTGQSGSLWHPPILGNIPAVWDQLDLPFVHRTLQLRTSAGCSFSCAFCSYPEIARGFHDQEIDNLDAHVRSALARPGVDRIIWLDDTPNVPKERWSALCDLFSRHDFEWFSFLRVQYIDDDMARRMRDSGCRGVYLGLESANDTVLKNMNKKARAAQFARGLAHLKKHGIKTMAAFVLGFPGETSETLRDNIAFIENNAIDFFTLKEFYYQTNTPVHRDRALYDLTGSGSRWQHATMNSDQANAHKLAMMLEVKNSVLVDPDTSLWHVAYLYDQGFSFDMIANMQKEINAIMFAQINGCMDDNHPGFARIKNLLADHLSGVRQGCQRS